MTFNSVEFIFLFAVTYLIYRIFSLKGKNLILLAASYIFYASWDVRFVFLLVLSTAVDFYCGSTIEAGRLSKSGRSVAAWNLILAAFFCMTVEWNAVRIETERFALSVDWNRILPDAISGWLILIGTGILVAIANLLYPRAIALPEKQRRDLFLWISICTNLGLLAFFKYCNFFIDSAVSAIRTLGIQAELLHLNIVLPVAISFYTFKTISYIVDIYRGKLQPTAKFAEFALFLAYFPALLAGPIDRASNLLTHLSKPRQLSFEQSAQGVFLILFGLFKKVAISDGVAGSVNAIYGTSGAVSWIDVVLATCLYAIQIYGDFSGYTDMARGISKLFGIELMLNFNLPYFSKDPSEFWRRWHISLSTWLRDYLYIPLGGNRQGEFRTYVNLMATMVLGGLWHGAAWNFVLWGFYQGALLCVYRVFSPQDQKQSASPNGLGNWQGILATLLFFGLTCYGWLLFRATSLAQIINFTKILFVDIGNFALTMPKPPLPALLGIPILIGYEFFAYKSQNQDFYLRYPTPARAAIYATLLVIVFMGLSNAPAQYIYFQF